jgi:hypothetical protein
MRLKGSTKAAMMVRNRSLGKGKLVAGKVEMR